MKKLLLIILLSISLHAEFKVMVYGMSKHDTATYPQTYDYIGSEGQVLFTRTKQRKYNSEHNLFGLEYAWKDYSIAVVNYKNSFYIWTTGVYVSKLWKNSYVDLKFGAGLANGYDPNLAHPEIITPVCMPSIQKSFDNIEIEVGVLGRALIGMFKIRF